MSPVAIATFVIRLSMCLTGPPPCARRCRIDILLGNETDKIRERGHSDLPTYGVGKEYDKREWQAVFRQMMGHDLVRPDAARHGALRMTDAALPILRGEASISLRRDSIRAAASQRRPAVKAMVSDEDAPLLSALKAKRRPPTSSLTTAP